MNCEQSQNLFDAYLDKTLTGTLATEFGAHQLACGHCRRDLALLEVAGHVVATDGGAPLLDDEFTNRLVECATDTSTKRPLKFSRALWVGLPTAMAACLTMIVWLGGDDTTDTAGPNEGEVKVLGFHDEVESTEEIYENVLKALSLDPTNEDLKRKADLLRAKSEKIIGDTRNGASLLQDYSEDAIREIVGAASKKTQSKSAQSDSASRPQDEAAQGQQNGSQNAGSDADNSTNAKPPTEEL
ncbi:MAG: hypothetical protein DHS20C16_11850 [Phycisphaerae bacterium]|nr:MAG: hypothetical protein DHS20C16_11850 [Phycisphaerae bacterium]